MEKIMKLQHFRSDWNGLRSEKPYHTEPTLAEVKAIHNNNNVTRADGVKVFADNKMVEVRMFVGNGLSGNVYRDFYRIINQ